MRNTWYDRRQTMITITIPEWIGALLLLDLGLYLVNTIVEIVYRRMDLKIICKSLEKHDRV